MKRIYEAANNVEAHMLAHLLSQSGIEAHIQGEHLQSGAGELPLAGLVGIAVVDERAAEATRIIREWEARTAPAPDPSQVAQAKRTFFAPMLAFIVGALSGATVVWSLHHGPETSEVMDWNGDGRPDRRTYYDGGRISRVEYLNPDGAVVKRVLYRDGYKQDVAQLDLDADGDWERTYRFDRYDEPMGQ
jgi:hypothetical protein